jgi:hypothetical protein
VKAKRQAWPGLVGWLDPARLVFVDETWASTNMGRRYGRSPRGEPLVADVPHGHWKTTTFVAALRGGGMTAPVVDGATTGTCSRPTSSSNWCRRSSRATWS